VAVYEVIGLYKGRVIFRQHIPKKHKCFGIKLYKLCEENGYTYDTKIQVGKKTQRRVQDLAITHVTVTRKLQGCGHKLYTDNFFSPPQLVQDLAIKNIYCCGTVRPSRTGMPQDLGPKKMTLKRGKIHVRTRGHLTAILWRDKRNIYMLTNIQNDPTEGNFCDSNWKAIKLQIVADYSRHRCFADKGDRIANSYSICRQTLKWTKTLFFHLLNLAILNSYIHLSSCGRKKISHRDFRFTLVRNMLVQAGYEQTIPRPLAGQPSTASEINKLEGSGS
jgi:hypothetical protein